jgi:spore germination protein
MTASLACLAALAPSTPLLSGWMVFWNPTSIETFEKRASVIDEVMPEWMGMDSEGMPFIRPSLTDPLKKQFLATARKEKVRVLAMISNYANEAGGFEKTRVQKMIGDPGRRTRHIKALISLLKKDRLDGVDLDLESLDAEDRDNFSAYVREVGAALRKEKMTLSVTLHAKESEPGGWSSTQAQDWKAIGEVADIVKIMTYDFSWAGSEPGPIAPTDWVERVMRFGVSVVPPSKLDLGIAAYGYDWNSKPAASLTWEDWAKKTASSTMCPQSSEKVDGKMRFSGSASFAAKQSLAKKLGLRGLAVWYFGSEEPDMWKKIPGRQAAASGRF